MQTFLFMSFIYCLKIAAVFLNVVMGNITLLGLQVFHFLKHGKK